MDQRSENIEYLWRQYIAGKASMEEVAALFACNKELGDEEQSSLIEQILAEYGERKLPDNEMEERMLYDILNGKKQDNHRVRSAPFLHRWWAAASIIVMLSIGAYFWMDNKKSTSLTNTAIHAAAILSGMKGAILTLADGRKVVLDSLENGVIAIQNGANVLLKNGQLTYAVTGDGPREMSYNTMSTPEGRQFQLALPDGTQVWLNAASSIRYPTVFTGSERRVEVKGEVYFEVAKKTRMPFRVNVNQLAEVEVLGTSFNVNAYENEANIKTTLQEGSVRVLVGSMTLLGTGLPAPDQKSADSGVPDRAEAILKPGEQAQIHISKKTSQLGPDAIKVIKNTDIEEVLAWKEGLFNFNGLTFEESMRQLERWYHIKVVYENNKVPNIRLGGKMTRGVSLNDLLKQLEKMGVRYKLDARVLRVLP